MRYCTKVLTSDGEESPLDELERSRILNDEIIGQFAKNGLRTLVYAYKDVDSEHWEDLQAEHNNFVSESDREIIENDLVFVAAFGLNDEVRDGVREAISKLRQANINTRMISGDNIETAIACAKKAGILQEHEEDVPMRCMTGEEFTREIGGVRKV